MDRIRRRERRDLPLLRRQDVVVTEVAVSVTEDVSIDVDSNGVPISTTTFIVSPSAAPSSAAATTAIPAAVAPAAAPSSPSAAATPSLASPSSAPSAVRHPACRSHTRVTLLAVSKS
jgi:hypothetical protein